MDKEEEEMSKKMKEEETEPLPEWEIVMEKCLGLLGRDPEGKGPLLYSFNNFLLFGDDEEERENNIGEDKVDEDGGKRLLKMQVISLAEELIRRPEQLKHYELEAGG